MKYLFGILLSILILSCNSNDDKDSATYFGGKIINPMSDNVFFLKNSKIIDTLYIDKNNNFSVSFENFEEGLYTFKHGMEFQYIFIEPKDSIFIRLNTWDFDESLVFSGEGAEKNNFLINLFLRNEKEEIFIHKKFGLEEDDFQAKIDSISANHKEMADSFYKNEKNINENFKELVFTANNYPLYRFKEVYPYYYKKIHKLESFPEFSEGFYSHREDVNFNQPELLALYPYMNFLLNHFYHIGHKIMEDDSTKDDITVNVLNSVVEKIDSEEVKNAVLMRIIINNFFKKTSTCTIEDMPLEIFLKNSTSSEDKEHIKKLVNDSKFLKNKKALQNFDLISSINNIVQVADIIKDENTVLYFWSTDFMSSYYLSSRIKFLEEKYPSISFIGVQMKPYFDMPTNMDDDLPNRKIQYKIPDNSFANEFLTSKFPRTVIINKQGIIINGFTSLSSKTIESELTDLEKK